MKATTRRGAAGALPENTKKRRKKKKTAAARGFMCGCGGSKSVSCAAIAATTISAAAAAAKTTPMKQTSTAPSEAKATTAATTTSAVRAGYHVAGEADDDADGTSPSVDALLQELRELELGVRALGVREREEHALGTDAPRPRMRHRRSATDWVAGGRLDAESVAVVTESDDPLGDFRRSMVQMVVENGITGGAELRELLQRFLSLNSPRHHHLILRAFADVWKDLFAGGGSRVLLQSCYLPNDTSSTRRAIGQVFGVTSPGQSTVTHEQAWLTWRMLSHWRWRHTTSSSDGGS